MTLYWLQKCLWSSNEQDPYCADNLLFREMTLGNFQKSIHQSKKKKKQKKNPLFVCVDCGGDKSTFRHRSLSVKWVFKKKSITKMLKFTSCFAFAGFKKNVYVGCVHKFWFKKMSMRWKKNIRPSWGLICLCEQCRLRLSGYDGSQIHSDSRRLSFFFSVVPNWWSPDP